MRFRQTFALLAVLTAALGNPAAAQVYRCEQGDTTVFSGVPCSDSAELLDMRSGISVVAAADDLGEVAERNKAFIDQRQEKLATRRAQAAEVARQAEQSRQRRAAAEEIRYRTIIGPAADSGYGNARFSPTDPRLQAQRRRDRSRDEPERRRTLLSRSGGNRAQILR